MKKRKGGKRGKNRWWWQRQTHGNQGTM